MATSEDVIESDIEAEPAVPFDAPWGQIALIRRAPLLLVRYEPIGSDDSIAEEVGVFLSADDEKVEEGSYGIRTSGHDDWIYEKIQKHPKMIIDGRTPSSQFQGSGPQRRSSLPRSEG